MPETIEVAFFDTHVHARRPPMMNVIARDVRARTCGGILMPNTGPHLLTESHVREYLTMWRALVGAGQWVGTIYLNDETNPNEVERAFRAGLIAGVKWYPPGHQQSDKSVTPEMLIERIGKTGELLLRMQELEIPLLLHGEVNFIDTEEETDPYDREWLFVQNILHAIRTAFPTLPISLEHISSEEGVEYMEQYGDPKYMVCTVTAHHLALDRRHVYQGGFLRPDHHCLPPIKHARHKRALHRLIQGKHAFVLAGTDLAPHDRDERKHTDCCFGGIYTGHCSVELYVEILEKIGVLNYVDDFLWKNARAFYGELVPENPARIKLVREPWRIESPIQYEESSFPMPGGRFITPFGYFPKESERWQFQWKLAA